MNIFFIEYLILYKNYIINMSKNKCVIHDEEIRAIFIKIDENNKNDNDENYAYDTKYSSHNTNKIKRKEGNNDDKMSYLHNNTNNENRFQLNDEIPICSVDNKNKFRGNDIYSIDNKNKFQGNDMYLIDRISENNQYLYSIDTNNEDNQYVVKLDDETYSFDENNDNIKDNENFFSYAYNVTTMFFYDYLKFW